MRIRRLTSPTTALIVGVIVLVLLVAFLPVLSLAHQLSLGSYGAPYAIFVAFASVGFVIARRRPSNPIGWLMLVGIGAGILGTDAGYYAWAAYGVRHHGLPLDWLALIIGEAWESTTILAAFPIVILLLPDGIAPSRGWRRVIIGFLGLVASGVACKLALAVTALSGDHLNAGTVNNGPGGGLLYNLPAGTRWLTVVPAVSDGAAVLLIAAAVIYQVISYRRASGARRQQLKCVMVGLTVCVLASGALASGTAGGGNTLVQQICRRCHGSPSRPCRSASASRSSDIGCMRSTGWSAARFPTRSSPPSSSAPSPG